MASQIVILGAGHAGGPLAARLREAGGRGAVTLVGDEPYPPYQRPPLSKAWLSGRADLAGLLLKPENYYARQSIALLTGRRAIAIDRGNRRVALADGSRLDYDVLVLATGARPRALPTAPPQCLSLRGIDDADRLKSALRPGCRLAIVGGGYIGLEVAAAAQALGCHSVVIEREPRLLARVASAPLSLFFQSYHAARGVAFRLGAEVAAISDTAVHLRDGGEVACDAVLIGIGAVANDELARAAGLACDQGVVVDAQSRSSDPHIFAIGDVALRPSPLDGRPLRLESVANALEQARLVAAILTERPLPPPEVPWFWSDQYDVKLQIAGLPFGADHTVPRGDPRAPGFAVFHLSAGRVRAVEAVNAPADFIAGKTLIAQRRPVDAARLADPAVALKELL